jgi:hypothetical protein
MIDVVLPVLDERDAEADVLPFGQIPPALRDLRIALVPVCQ